MKGLKYLILAAVLMMCGFTMSAAAAEPLRGTKTFNKAGFGYVIQYPDGWLSYTEGRHTAMFIGKEGTKQNYPTVVIKNLLAASQGGKFRAVDGVITDLENQLRSTSEAMVFNPEPFKYTKDGFNLTGTQCVAEYTIKKERFKQWAVVMPDGNKPSFYVWSYTAPEAAYDVYLPIAKAMFDSWVLKE
ncbi:MAG TPA: hypothetical protein VGJ94_12945 [Syntrophorhabdaceae bacterium]|jgi:hypothetical protein